MSDLVDCIPAVMKDKFEVRKFVAARVDEDYVGSTTQTVVHNGVKLTFKIALCPNQSREKDCVAVFLKYTDGPKEKIAINVYFYAVRDSSETKLLLATGADLHGELVRNGNGFGWPNILPRNLASLADQGWLSCNYSILQIIATVTIPESAFDDPEMAHQAPPDPLRQTLYNQIGVFVDTRSPYKFNRFDFISSDDQHFYIHKDMLSIASEQFKQMFDSDTPEESQFDYIRAGSVQIQTLNSSALREIFSFIYLGRTSPELKNNCALQVLDGANKYGLHGLLLLCEQRLIAETKQNKDLNSLLAVVRASLTLNRPALTTICMRSVASIKFEQKDISEGVVLRWIELSIEHGRRDLRDLVETNAIELVQLQDSDLTRDGILQLIIIAHEHDLDRLMDSCSFWLCA